MSRIITGVDVVRFGDSEGLEGLPSAHSWLAAGTFVVNGLADSSGTEGLFPGKSERSTLIRVVNNPRQATTRSGSPLDPA